MYALNNWIISDVTYLTPQPGEAPVAGRNYVTLDIPDLSVTPLTNLYLKAPIAESAIGNTLETVCNFDDGETGSYFTMYIDDGTHRAGINVFKGFLRDLTGAITIPVTNTDAEDHRYTITLKNGVFSVLFDTDTYYTGDVSTASTSSRFGLGFFESQTGSMTLNFRYIKETRGIYQYIKPKDIDFELQIDTVNTFDSINLRNYTRESFDNIPAVPDDWDPVGLVCGNYTETGYDFNGLVQSATVHLPVRQDQQDITFYYRVRFKKTTDVYDMSPSYISDWSTIYITKRVKPTQISVIDPSDFRKISLVLTEDSDTYQAVVPEAYGLGVLLPTIPTTDNLTFTIYNAGEYDLKVYSHSVDEQTEKDIYYNPYTIPALSMVRISYDETTNKWYMAVVRKQATFILPQNIETVIFDAVFNHHIPAYDFVYTKTYNSGNVADFVRANSSEIDSLFKTFTSDKNDLDSFQAKRDQFNQRWSNVFGLDASLFKNAAEMRDLFQCLLANLSYEMIKSKLEELIIDATGAKPLITEYKDVNFNLLGDKSYYLYDPEHPLYGVKPFILYGGAAKAFTWQIDVYDTYNLQYNQELIRNIVEIFKPVYTYAVVNFYSFEGTPLRKRYIYGYDNFGEGSYTIDEDTPVDPNDYLMASNNNPLAYTNGGIISYLNIPQILENTLGN